MSQDISPVWIVAGAGLGLSPVMGDETTRLFVILMTPDSLQGNHSFARSNVRVGVLYGFTRCATLNDFEQSRCTERKHSFRPFCAVKCPYCGTVLCYSLRHSKRFWAVKMYWKETFISTTLHWYRDKLQYCTLIVRKFLISLKARLKELTLCRFPIDLIGSEVEVSFQSITRIVYCTRVGSKWCAVCGLRRRSSLMYVGYVCMHVWSLWLGIYGYP